MKYEEINKRFTAKVAEYMEKGYCINTGSMSGMQGEIAKVDMAKGKDLIRIMLTDIYEGAKDGVVIVVGKVTDKITPHETSHVSNIVWNEHLQIIERSEVFYHIGFASSWFGTSEEIEEWRKIRRARRERNPEVERIQLPLWATKIGYFYAKKMPRTKTLKPKDVRVYKEYNKWNGRFTYYVEAKDKRYRLG